MRGKGILLVVLAVCVVGAGSVWWMSRPNWQRRAISYDGFVGPPQSLPSGVYLFQSEAELQQWLAPYGKKASRTDPQYLYIPDVDFSRETVAYLVNAGGCGLQSVSVHGDTVGFRTVPGSGQPHSSPALRPGERYYSAIIFRLPKVHQFQVSGPCDPMAKAAE